MEGDPIRLPNEKAQIGCNFWGSNAVDIVFERILWTIVNYNRKTS